MLERKDKANEGSKKPTESPKVLRFVIKGWIC